MPDLLKPFIDVLYGSRCALCLVRRGAGEDMLCEACRAALRPTTDERCERCGVRIGPHTEAAGRCLYCRSRRYRFRSVLAPFSYEGVVRDQIHAAKFLRQEQAARRLARMFADALRRSLPDQTDLIVPVPMFWWERRTRGVYLVGRLAEALSEAAGIEMNPHALRQLRLATRQFTLSLRRREENVDGLFGPAEGLILDGRTVLLVDDILTTGATANACARVLRAAGAKVVHAAVLARTEPPEER